MVSGPGENLPGLLGLRSLEALRAILDTEHSRLIFLGPGEVKYELPSGSTVIPLENAPSGHLVMLIDDYDHVATRWTGGLPEVSLSLHTHAQSDTEPPVQTGADNEQNCESNAGPEQSADGLTFNI